MIRYATERYLDIELILEDESGLKIPKTAVTEKEFYIVPQDYITSGGGSNNTGVLVQGKKNSVEFQEATVYYRDIETDMAYLDMDSFKEGTVLQKPDSGDAYTLSKQLSFQVYITSTKAMQYSARSTFYVKVKNTIS